MADEQKPLATWLGVSAPETKPGEKVVRDAVEFKKAWDYTYSRGQPDPKLPDVDFAKNLVVFVYQGTKPSTGHYVTVKDCRVVDKKVLVRVVETSPDPGDITVAATTSPFVIAVLPKADAVEISRSGPDED